jgi:hypothetical protein
MKLNKQSWISYEIVLEWDKVKKFSVRYNYPWDYHLATSPEDTPDSYTHPINIGFHDTEHKSNNIWQNHFEYSVIKNEQNSYLINVTSIYLIRFKKKIIRKEENNSQCPLRVVTKLLNSINQMK